MSEISTIAAVMASFKALKDLAAAMIDLHDGRALALKVREFNGILIDTQTLIFTVNQERSVLIDLVRDLKEQIAAIEKWDAEKQRYELESMAPGSFAYAIKTAMQGVEPPHQICAHCYQLRKKSILQRVPDSPHATMFGRTDTCFCPDCKTVFINKG